MKGYWEHRDKLLKFLGRELTIDELMFAIELYFMGDQPRTVAHYLWEREGR